MKYFIDGYNFLLHLTDHIYDIDLQRENFLSSLEDLLSKKHLKATIVFDSKFPHAKNYPTTAEKKYLTVIFAPENQSADDYLVELLSTYKNPKNISVITHDKTLQFHLKQLHIQILSAEDFLKRLYKKKSSDNEEKPSSQNSREFQRWLHIFESKLH